MLLLKSILPCKSVVSRRVSAPSKSVELAVTPRAVSSCCQARLLCPVAAVASHSYADNCSNSNAVIGFALGTSFALARCMGGSSSGSVCARMARQAAEAEPLD